jgi:acetyl esterase/lipase
MLQYRLPAGRHDVPLQDAERAIRYLREHAKELGISRIGIMGCSAGGHLASTLATHYSSAETRPDFQILLYPVITMETPYTHMGSRECLLGKDAPQTLVDLYSNEKQVTKDTPKAFIVLASDDMLVPVQNSTRYYEALVANGVEATLMCYPTGNHGFGHHETFLYRENWFNELETWIEKSL